MTTTPIPAIAALDALFNANDDFMIDMIDAITDDPAPMPTAIRALLACLTTDDRNTFMINLDICPMHLTDTDSCADDDLTDCAALRA
jgi:hypothetical protein